MALSRERILFAALDLVEQDGWDGLSMRRLAHDLDVWPMAVYRYFRDKDELLHAMAGAAAERIALPSARGSWRTRTRRLLVEARRVLGPHAGSRTALSPAEGRLSGAGVEILRDAGFEEADAVTAWRSLFGYAIGFPEDEDAEFEFGLECLLDGLDARRVERS